jgi:hypothetical protein
MASILETHRSYIGPPGMDAAAIAAFRTAVSAAMKDKALLEESTKGDRPLDPMDGAKVQQVVADITKADAKLAPILKAAVKEIQ